MASNLDTTIKLRPHHLMCIAFYKGKGYSKDFVDNMTTITSALKDDDAKVLLTQGVDEICAHCPNNINNVCKDEEKSKTYDEKTLLYLGLDDYFSDPQPIPYSILGHLTEKFILSKGHRENICDDCQWSSICKR